MRSLDRNKIKLWVVEPDHQIPKLDVDGFDTGERTTVYSIPRAIFLALQPSVGDVSERIFGKDVSPDMVSVSTDVILTPDSLIFESVTSETEPIANPSTTYSYRVASIKASLNVYAYALKRRT